MDSTVRRSAVINGAVQFGAGAASSLFSILAYFILNANNNDDDDVDDNHHHDGDNHDDDRRPADYYVGAGVWTGIFFVVSGIVTVAAGVKQRSFPHVAASLAFSVIGVSVGLFNFFLHVPFLAKDRQFYHCWERRSSFSGGRGGRGGGGKGVDADVGRTTDCPDHAYRVVVGLSIVAIVAAFVQIIAAISAVVLAAKAIHRHRRRIGRDDEEENANVEKVAAASDPAVTAATATSSSSSSRSGGIAVNSVAQASTTVVSMATGVIILFIVAYGVQSDKNDKRALIGQTNGSSLWTGPFFLLAAFFGFRAAKVGENVTSLVAFLCLNVWNLLISSLVEMTGAAMALADRWSGMRTLTYDHLLPGGSGSTSSPHSVDDLHSPGKGTASSSPPDNDDASYQFFTPLVVFNGVVVFAAAAHFLLALWGIVAAALALRREGTRLDFRGCCRCLLSRDDDEAPLMTKQIQIADDDDDASSPRRKSTTTATTTEMTTTLGEIIPVPDVTTNGSLVVTNGTLEAMNESRVIIDEPETATHESE